MSHPAILDSKVELVGSIYGIVTFSNERGVFKRVECATRSDYERELNAGATWAALEPRRPLSVEGQVLVPTDPVMFGRDLKGVQ